MRNEIDCARMRTMRRVTSFLKFRTRSGRFYGRGGLKEYDISYGVIIISKKKAWAGCVRITNHGLLGVRGRVGRYAGHLTRKVVTGGRDSEDAPAKRGPRTKRRGTTGAAGAEKCLMYRADWVDAKCCCSFLGE